MFKTGFPSHWSTLKKLIWFRALKGRGSSGDYTAIEGIVMAKARYVITDFYLTGADTLRFSAKGANSGWLGCFTSTDATDNYSFYASSNATAKYARYNGQTGGSSVTNSYKIHSVVMTPDGITGIRNPTEWTPSTFTASSPLTIGALSPTQTTSSSVTFIGNIVVDGRLKLMPCVRNSDGVIGWRNGTTFYEPTIESGGSVSIYESA